jgi:thiamine kinase-like enzyme
LFWEPIIRNLRYNASIRDSRVLNSERLAAYLRVTLRNKNSPLMLGETDSVEVSNITRIGMGSARAKVYSFLLTYTEKNKVKKLHLIIKTFIENIDPILDSYIHDCDLRMCVREWEAMKNLEQVGFPVPKAYLCECESRFLGYPFVIMSEVQRAQMINSDQINNFASSLAHLHNLEIDKMEFTAFKAPKDGYAFARRWPIHFKHFLSIETKHSARLKKDFDFAISWLESNVSSNYCPKYSLIHCDAHPGNSILTNDSQMVFVDWEGVDIGDPAFDVGLAYHTIKFFSNPKDPNSAEQIAERFLSKYLQEYKGDIRSRLEFYQVVSILLYMINRSSCLASPIKAYEHRKNRVMLSIPFLKLPIILFGFPFLRFPFIARQLALEQDIYWLKYFEKFMEKLN